MRRYSPSEKLSDEYLATERKTLKNFLMYTFSNPYKAQVAALEQIEDRYEQLKEIVRLQDEVRNWFSSESYAKEWALFYLEMLELSGSDEEEFIRQTSWSPHHIFNDAKEFFEIFKTNPEEWKKRNTYKDGRNHFHSFYPQYFSEETINEILQIGDKFSANLWKKDFTLIEASKLSLNDAIFQHNPQNEQERVFRECLEEVIKNGVKDFWKAKRDPSKTYYVFRPEKAFEGFYPDTGRTYWYWEVETAKGNCRLGKKSEYIAFLGVLLKKLVESGWTTEKAWNAVCVDSYELGHYRHPQKIFGVTVGIGSKKICGFYDLASTRKLLAEDKDSGCFACWHASGHCGELGTESPLATLRYDDERNCNHPNSVGWIVRDVEE